MAEGTVKWFDDRKGFGFITDDRGDGVFIHHSSIEGQGFKTLNENQRVSFDIEEGKKGPMAVNAKIL